MADTTRSRLTSNLTVTVTPTQSAFFAGELFTAQITFTNTHLPASLLPRHSPTTTRRPSSSSANGGGHPNARPFSASQANLSEYATDHLDQDPDRLPASPYYGISAAAGLAVRGTVGNGSERDSHNEVIASRNDSVINGTGRGGEGLPTSIPPSHIPVFQPRETQSSAQLNATASSSRLSSILMRKGLIGLSLSTSTYPAPSSPSPFNGASGRSIEGGGSHNMAVSNPELLSGKRDRSFQSNGSVDGSSQLSMSDGVRGNVPSSSSTDLNTSLSAFSLTSPPKSNPNSTTFPSVQTPSPRRRPEALRSTSATKRRSASTFSSNLSLAESDDDDPLDNSSSSLAIARAQEFYHGGQNEAMDDITRAGLDERARNASWPAGSRSAGAGTTEFQRRTAGSMSGSNPPRVKSASTTMFPAGLSRAALHSPGSLILLWSFVHLEGTFEVDETLIKVSEFNEVKKLLLAGFGSGIGGGSLEEMRGAPGWRDWLWGRDSETSTTAGASLEERKISMMNNRTVPTFSSPPSILGIDVILEPGESKTYSFSIPIPADLPPSFRGKSIKFSYQLVLGTNQTPLGLTADSYGSSTRGSISRIMKVPVRVYNHVAVTGARPFYDLTNPIVYHRDEATIAGDDVKLTVRTRRASTGREDFEEYASSLLDSVCDKSLSASLVGTGPPPSPIIRLREKVINMESVPALRPEMRERTRSGSVVTLSDLYESAIEQGEEEEIVGCKAAVEIVSRNSKKVSYDINKDGYMVATLTLVKSAYRLGETVNGSVVINSGDGRVLRVSARLETHELVETSIATKSAAQLRQLTRRLHAEHHETTLDSARVGFALSIPSGATPDFATSGVKLQWSVRLSFLVIPPSPDAPVVAPTPTRSTLSSLPSPSTTPPKPGHGRSKSFAYGFEPAVPLTLPAAPMIMPTGAAHLMPIVPNSLDAVQLHTSYRAVPDLGFVPVLFSSSTSLVNLEPAPGPLQRSVKGGIHRSTPSLSSLGGSGSTFVSAPSVVLVPAKVETVECSIPIKIYPGNTAFRPTVVVFDA